MKNTEYLLVKVAEECFEVGQRATKAARFGLGEVQPGQSLTNGQRLLYELADLLVALELLEEAEMGFKAEKEEFVSGALDEHRRAHREQILKFMDYSRECGTLEP